MSCYNPTAENKTLNAMSRGGRQVGGCQKNWEQNWGQIISLEWSNSATLPYIHPVVVGRCRRHQKRSKSNISHILTSIYPLRIWGEPFRYPEEYPRPVEIDKPARHSRAKLAADFIDNPFHYAHNLRLRGGKSRKILRFPSGNLSVYPSYWHYMDTFCLWKV